LLASSNANRGFGDDFDDFEEGAEADGDDDFGDFDEGFEEPALVQGAQSAAQPVQEASIPLFVSSDDLTMPYDEISVLRHPLSYSCLYSFSLSLTIVQSRPFQTY
jgi:hypothetical protein